MNRRAFLSLLFTPILRKLMPEVKPKRLIVKARSAGQSIAIMDYLRSQGHTIISADYQRYWHGAHPFVAISVRPLDES